MIKRFKILLYVTLDSRCNRTKKLLNWLSMLFGWVKNSPSLLRIIFENSDSLVFKEIIDSFPSILDIINVVSKIIMIIRFFTLF